MTQSEPDAQTEGGDPRVDALLDRLDDLDNVELPTQLDVFTDVHAALAQILDGPPLAP